jgi:hypothetical protein
MLPLTGPVRETLLEALTLRVKKGCSETPKKNGS